MRVSFALLIGLSVILLSGCTGDDVDVAEDTESEQTFRTDTSTAEVEEGMLSNDQLFDLIDAGIHPSRLEGRSHIIEELPEPLDITAEPHENRHIPNQIDTLKTYHYEGLELRTYEISDDPQIILTGITITSSAYTSPDGIYVGMTREEVEDAMMTPDEEADDLWTYHFQTEATNTFMVYFEGDEVERLEWGFYFD